MMFSVLVALCAFSSTFGMALQDNAIEYFRSPVRNRKLSGSNIFHLHYENESKIQNLEECAQMTLKLRGLSFDFWMFDCYINAGSATTAGNQNYLEHSERYSYYEVRRRGDKYLDDKRYHRNGINYNSMTKLQFYENQNCKGDSVSETLAYPNTCVADESGETAMVLQKGDMVIDYYLKVVEPSDGGSVPDLCDKLMAKEIKYNVIEYPLNKALCFPDGQGGSIAIDYQRLSFNPVGHRKLVSKWIQDSLKYERLYEEKMRIDAAFQRQQAQLAAERAAYVPPKKKKSWKKRLKEYVLKEYE